MSAEWITRHEAEPPKRVGALEIDALEKGRLHRLSIVLLEDGASRPIRIPVLVARGAEPGPLLGITAALHGNELNGIPTIHRLFQRIDPKKLRGSVAAVTIANMPAYIANQRKYTDGQDLNRLMPGKADGNESQVYGHRLMDRVVSRFNYLLDLHTASFGRVNTLYVRADMSKEITARMARQLGAEIILNNASADGTMRGAAEALGIPSVTVEIGDPQVFDPKKIRASRIGLRDVIEDLGLLDPDHEDAPPTSIECRSSYWLYTDTGGVLEVPPALAQRLKAGEVIARLVNPWGQVLRTYRAPEDGVVIGKSTNPCAHTGSRILHLGLL